MTSEDTKDLFYRRSAHFTWYVKFILYFINPTEILAYRANVAKIFCVFMHVGSSILMKSNLYLSISISFRLDLVLRNHKTLARDWVIPFNFTLNLLTWQNAEKRRELRATSATAPPSTWIPSRPSLPPGNMWPLPTLPHFPLRHLDRAAHLTRLVKVKVTIILLQILSGLEMRYLRQILLRNFLSVILMNKHHN